ncbi:MAG TPA: hypothetical protein VF808_01900 [Ktedonobacterales bacterium]
MTAERRPSRLTRSTTVLAALAIIGLSVGLAACAPGVSATSTTATQPTASSSSTTASTTPQPQLTPLPPGIFTTYINTAYSYSIGYPHNWYVEGATATSESFIVFNYDPQTYQQPSSAPPLLKIELDIVPNPASLSALDLFKQTASGPGEPAVTIVSAQEVALAGHPSTQIIWSSAASLYPTITYVSITPHTTNALFISQSNAAGGQPGTVFTQMLASLAITG